MRHVGLGVCFELPPRFSVWYFRSEIWLARWLRFAMSLSKKVKQKLWRPFELSGESDQETFRLGEWNHSVPFLR